MKNYIVNVKYKKSSVNFSVKAFNRKDAIEEVKIIMNNTTLFAFSDKEKKKLIYRVRCDK